ncbi:MAG: winged helix-turn-helix transcriptional regulator, partial [Anaerolineaceae bacterium]|nr:winged helix-turn-helix transcriptional regulator [Anaerolineaceae bacterium]
EEILTEVLQNYPNGFYWLPILRAQVMLALALFYQHKINQSSQMMAEAARIAAPEFFIRPFLVSGEKIVSLLSLVLHTENLNLGTRSFIKGILTTLGYEKGATDIIPKKEFASLEIAVSITPREQQILRLLNANLSNQEIADQCSISSSTVKTHLENIYRKLGVDNRAQAISEARMLNLV